MKKILLTLALLFCTETAYAYAKTPLIDIAPGQLCTVRDKDFHEFRYEEQIPYCRRNVTPKRKDKICSLYGVRSRNERQKHYTVDHIVPLSMGGSNSDKNLWCQNKKIYTGDYEYRLYLKLRNGELRQAETLLIILSHKYNPDAKLPNVDGYSE